MSQLRIFISGEWRDAASHCPWVLLDEPGAILQSGTGNLASMPRADECVAIVAAAQVLCVAQTLPRIKARQLETALPLALEEFLLGEAIDNHVVPGKTLTNGQTVLYAIDKDWLRQLVEACAVVAIRLRRILPEFSLLPVPGGEWNVVWNGLGGWLALPNYQGWVLGRGDAARAPATLILQLAAAQQAPDSVRIFFPAGLGAEQRVLPDWKGINLVPGTYPFDWRVAPLAADTPNLLWGKFAPPQRLQEWWPRLRPVVWILVLVLGIETAGYNLQWWWLAHEKKQLVHAMHNVFQETFGSDAEVVDAPLQMRRRLASLRHAAGVADDADFLPLLERVSDELASRPGVQVTGLRYTEGGLDMEAHLPGRSELNLLQQRLYEQGLHVQQVEARENGSLIYVHLRIGSGGAR